MIHLDHLSYTYPGSADPALRDVSLDIGEGEFTLVSGPSGSGKSTLLRVLNGLVPHFTGGSISGSAVVSGYDPISEGPEVLSRVVGFVFQDPESQFVVDRVEDEVAFALENAAVPPTEMRLRVEEVLHLLDLTALRDRPLDTLSGGEKQRVAIATALAFRPRILALDEPTSQLDPQAAEDVLQALVRLNQDLGLTVVIAEHRLERILPYVDRMVHLSESGDGVVTGAPRRVLQQMDLTPPLVTLAKELGWEPLPLTVKEGRQLASDFNVRASSCQTHTPSGATTVPTTAQGEPRPACDPQLACDPRLALHNLRFAYNGKPVLRDIDLEIEPGELVALMGRNGSGKTTLLRCIVGLLMPERGEIEMGGTSIIGRATADICKNVGYLPQDPRDLLFADTVLDEFKMTLRNHGLVDDPPLAPSELLERLELGEVVHRYPRDLSAGQRQRAALGAVTVTRPGVLLLDEPTRGLDYPAKRKLVQLLREWQDQGTSILLVTHDVELVAQAADRVLLLSQGEIIADASPEMLTASPLFSPQVARLFPGTGWLTADDALHGLNGGR
jgi:energy-coupling factor transport system ATP-binding protein